jgi:hypothetical protein
VALLPPLSVTGAAIVSPPKFSQPALAPHRGDGAVQVMSLAAVSVSVVLALQLTGAFT